MKYVFLVLSILPLQLFGQDAAKLLDVLPSVYAGVDTVDGVSKDELYDRGIRWMIDYFKSTNKVIELNDKDAGEVIGKGWVKETWNSGAFSSLDVKVWYTIKLQVKDGRYRYEIGNLRFQYRTDPKRNTAGYKPGQEYDVTPEEFARRRKRNARKFLVKVDERMREAVGELRKGMVAAKVMEVDW